MFEFVAPCSPQNSLNYFEIGLPAGRVGIRDDNAKLLQKYDLYEK